jgi:sugar O-acyltransferase (sialic acid O-acetyltransferase NeuD family)
MIISDKIIRELVIWGATGQARVLREFVESAEVRIVALFDNNRSVLSPFPDIPLYYEKQGFEEWLKERKDNQYLGCLAAIGGSKGKERLFIQSYLESFDIVSPIAVHPTAFVAKNAAIGEGSQILAQSAVCVDVRLGRSCIVNTGATVDHECQIGDGAHIGPGVHLASLVIVEDFAAIFTGAAVLPGIRIGANAIIGAGSVVARDVPPSTVVAGNPARVIRTLEEDTSSCKKSL